ncbi:hypothetical protein NDN01_24960 [Sphingomonas sp. QA11]|uniref:hypothetical protein n=1 Tax=Sphingomonas sp. QA11 TaxID=2950605 RepID=UPI00234AB4F9|nr:hypothetical protein [Sphingomonas sp. QA11]WCM27194.1 hypothetical protein NDN01_24960 [Sphingomonas sp. QA11]
MNRPALLALCLIAAGCVGQHDLANADRPDRAKTPETFDASPDLYDGKTIYVGGYVWATSHWWSDHVRQSPKDLTNCLNIGPSRFFQHRRRDLKGKWLMLKGIYKKGSWAGSLSACKKDNGLFLDDDYMEMHYPGLVRDKKDPREN